MCSNSMDYQQLLWVIKILCLQANSDMSSSRYNGVAIHLSTTYHPQTDGQTNVVNICLEAYLRCVVGEQPKTWARWLALTEWWYNSIYHSSINLTPFEAIYGCPLSIHLPYLVRSSLVNQVDTHLQDKD